MRLVSNPVPNLDEGSPLTTCGKLCFVPIDPYFTSAVKVKEKQPPNCHWWQKVQERGVEQREAAGRRATTGKPKADKCDRGDKLDAKSDEKEAR
jgi:hypothetical protein